MNKSSSLLLSLALGLVILAPAADASPRERAAKAKAAHAGSHQLHGYQRHVDRRAGSVDISGTTGDGRRFERHIDTVKTDNGYTRTMTATTPNGTVITRNTVATRNEDGSLSKDVTREVTAPAVPPQNAVDASE